MNDNCRIQDEIYESLRIRRLHDAHRHGFAFLCGQCKAIKYAWDFHENAVNALRCGYFFVLCKNCSTDNRQEES